MLSGKRLHAFREELNVKCPTFGTDKYCNINQLSVFCPTFRDMGRWDNVGHLHVLIPENLRI